MTEFVRRKVKGSYGNVSEFFRDLGRKKIEREIEADLAFLEATNKGTVPGPSENEIEEVVALQKRLRKSRRAQGRRL